MDDSRVSLPSDALTATAPGARRIPPSKMTEEDRRRLAERTLRQFPNRVPVVLQKSPKCRLENVPSDDYVVVPDDWTLGKFISALRKRISLSPTDGLYLYVNGTLPAVSTQLSVIYAEHQSNDKLLYIVFDTESTYG